MNRQVSAYLSQYPLRINLTLNDLKNIRSFSEIYLLVESSLYSGQAPSEAQIRLISLLLDGKNKESAKAKFNLYKELVGNNAVHVLIQRIAFDGMILLGKVSNYAESFYSDDVLAKKTVDEMLFYQWIRRMFNLKTGVITQSALSTDFFYTRLNVSYTDFHPKLIERGYLDRVTERLTDKFQGYSQQLQADFSEYSPDDLKKICNILQEAEKNWIKQ